MSAPDAKVPVGGATESRTLPEFAKETEALLEAKGAPAAKAKKLVRAHKADVKRAWKRRQPPCAATDTIVREEKLGMHGKRSRKRRVSRDTRSSVPPRPIQFEGHAREVTMRSMFREPFSVTVRDPMKTKELRREQSKGSFIVVLSSGQSGRFHDMPRARAWVEERLRRMPAGSYAAFYRALVGPGRSDKGAPWTEAFHLEEKNEYGRIVIGSTRQAPTLEEAFSHRGGARRDIASFALGAAAGATTLYAGQKLMERPRARATVRLGRIKAKRAAKAGARHTGQRLQAWGERDPGGAMATKKQMETIRARRVDDTARKMISKGVSLSWMQVDELGEMRVAWIGQRLGLNSYTDEEGVHFRPKGSRRDPGGPKSGRRVMTSRASGGGFSETMYHANEIALFRKELAQAEKADSREGTKHFARALAEEPELVAERIDWLLAGHYGQGAYLEAHKAIRGRSNAPAWLTQVIGALEWETPFRSTRAAWNKLSPAQKSSLARHVNQVITRNLKGGE